MKKKLMIIDDEALICKTLAYAFENTYDVITYTDPNLALSNLLIDKAEVIMLDLRLKTESGLDLLKKIKETLPLSEVIMMSAYATIDSSVEAMKLGAYNYLLKPLNIDEARMIVQSAFKIVDAHNIIETVESNSGIKYGMVGRSKKIENIINLINRSASNTSSVLIVGESGTGKELVAKAIHNLGEKTKSGDFIAVNCSAIPYDLIESELFGHVKGAFTGASECKKGIIELANNGTLFFDEIGEMDLRFQAKLLRVIQERELRAVGSLETKKINARFIFATNRDLMSEVQNGNFREDLYYRINVLKIEIPPLRERKEDIPGLVSYFIKAFSYRDGLKQKKISHNALGIIENYDFRGNIRELQNLVERLMIYTDGPIISEEIVKTSLDSKLNLINRNMEGILIPYESSLENVEKIVIENTLERLSGNRKLSSESLGIAERTLRYKIKEYNL